MAERSSPRPIERAACCSWRTGVTIRLAATYPRDASKAMATVPNTVIQVNRCLMGASNSSDDCQTNVCQDPLSGDPLVARLVSGKGAKPMTEVEWPPCPSPDACTQPGWLDVMSGTRLISEMDTPVGRIGQLMTMPRLSMSMTCPVLPNRMTWVEGEKNSLASITRCSTPTASYRRLSMTGREMVKT